LIELLVVVSIIALLISILLPSLKQAREQGKAAVCMSHLKQIGNAISYYQTDYPGWLPPTHLGRGRTYDSAPHWFQYLPHMYLDNHTGVSKCPSDDLVDSQDTDKKRGPYPDLRTNTPSIYYSYAINPDQPKKPDPVYPDNAYGRLEIVPYPYSEPLVVERFNPGIVTGLKRPAEFAFLLETASTDLLSPRSPFELFRWSHGTKKSSMNLIFADTHAGPRNIQDIYPSDFSTKPPEPLDDPLEWPEKLRALWFGDEKLTAAREM
jgi:type II secretory pathway pseudopilin PulG